MLYLMFHLNTLFRFRARFHLAIIIATAGVSEQWVKTLIFVPRTMYFSQAAGLSRSNLTEEKFVIRFCTNESEGR
jgi:hypothetical protein